MKTKIPQMVLSSQNPWRCVEKYIKQIDCIIGDFIARKPAPNTRVMEQKIIADTLSFLSLFLDSEKILMP